MSGYEREEVHTKGNEGIPTLALSEGRHDGEGHVHFTTLPRTKTILKQLAVRTG